LLRSVLHSFHQLQLQPAICSERISAVRIDQIGLLGQMYHHAVWPNDLLSAKAGISQWISGSVVEGAPTKEPRPDASNARSQRPATRAIGVSRAFFCLCVKRPWFPVSHRCFALPRSSILCGCINFPGRQVNAVWGRYPTACTMLAQHFDGQLSPRLRWSSWSPRTTGMPLCCSSWAVSGLYVPKTALAALASLYPFPVPVLPSSPAHTYLKQHFQPL
jgi:hypothetical protein